MTIHYSEYSSQPDILTACGLWTMPLWGHPKPIAPDIYWGEPPNEDSPPILFTYQRNLATCPKCLQESKNL